jgi:hypothetical protein
MPDPDMSDVAGRLAGLADVASRATVPPPAATIRRRARRRAGARNLAVGIVALAAVATGTVIVTRSPAPAPVPRPPAASPEQSPTPASTSPTPSADPTPTTTRTVPQAPPLSVVPCRKAAGLTVSTATGDAGAGHRSLTLVFSNHGTAPCRMTGYPGVAGLDGNGTQVAQAVRTLTGYLGGSAKVATITIPVGSSASATVEATAANQDGTACTPYVALLVTAPDDTASTKLSWGGDACANLEVHPVTPGQ